MNNFARACVLTVGLAGAAAHAGPISLHPDNPRYFLFRGAPTVLIASGEHYGAVLNLDFDFVPYLDELKARGLNQTRLFSGTYREVPGSFKIKENTLAPRPGRFSSPYARSDKPGAKDGGNLFDLDRWDDAHFARLREFVRLAGERGIVVEYVLFCPFYSDDLWAVNAWNSRNNVNETPDLPRTDVYTLKPGGLVARHEAFVRKAAAELNGFDNLYFEICNEPYFGGVTSDWQDRIAETIVSAEKDLPNKHLIARNVANGKAKVANPHPAVSIFNFHYARPPETVGLNYGLARPIGDDETGFQGTGDAVYRIEAWEFLLAGGAVFSHLDYSFTIDREDGTAPVTAPTPGGGGPTIRKQLSYLATFMKSIPFVNMKPDDPAKPVVTAPKGAKVRALVGASGVVALYARDVPAGASVSLASPPGRHEAEWFDVVAAKPAGSVGFESNGGPIELKRPEGMNLSEFAVIVRRR